MNIDKIMTKETIEFLQSKNSRDIKVRLQESISKCSSLKGAVAFWTIDIDYFDRLVEKLSHEDSFMCVDVHEPTKIDSLKKFVEGGAKNIYVFLYQVETARYPLMHSKLLLFDLPQGKSEIWIGSQNFTDSALSGFNFEATAVVSTTNTSVFYRQVVDYLNFIKGCCKDISAIEPEIGESFDPALDDFYKKLQNTYDWQEDEYKVLDFVCEDINDVKKISEQSELCVLVASFDRGDCKKFTPEQTIVVRALDKRGEVICYEATVLSSSAIAAESREDRCFVKTYTDDHGRHYQVGSYIIQYSDTIPVFFSESPNMTNQSSSVIIKIINKFDENLQPSNRQKFWKNAKEDIKLAFYLKTASEQKKKVIQIPKSPSSDKNEPQYPFDRIKNSEDLAFLIDELYQLAQKNNYDQYDGSRKAFRKKVMLGKSQTIIRHLVILKSGDTNKRQPPKNVSDVSQKKLFNPN